MSALTYTVTDSATMLRRSLRRLLRYPSMTLLLIGMPIVFLLLFVYVFGGELGAGLGRELAGGHTGRAGYLNYVAPGILLMTVAAAVQGTAIVVAMDMTGGIIDRFRTMAIARASVLTGHVLASLIQTLASIAVVLGVAIALGFRPTADLGRLAGGSRRAVALRAGADLARDRARAGRQERRDGEQHTDVPDHPGLPGKRVRSRRHDAGRAAPVRHISAVHPGDRDPAWAPHRHADRLQPRRHGRVERRHRPCLLPLGAYTSTTTATLADPCQGQNV